MAEKKSTPTAAQLRAAEAIAAGRATKTEEEIAGTIPAIDDRRQAIDRARAANRVTQAPVVTPTPTPTTVQPTPEIGEGRTLARDTFKKTLALMFGQEAMTAGWVDELYGTVAGFYRTGADVNESLNLALRDVRNNPNLKQFTNRFRGIFALEDRARKGEAVYVPSVAEYAGIQQKMGEVFRNAGLEDIATLDFTSDLISRNLSAVEIGNRINNVFTRIDNSPEELKATFREYFPMVTRNDLAKSLLLGEQGARELEQKDRKSVV